MYEKYFKVNTGAFLIKLRNTFSVHSNTVIYNNSTGIPSYKQQYLENNRNRKKIIGIGKDTKKDINTFPFTVFNCLLLKVP
jgi:hypothetical protein